MKSEFLHTPEDYWKMFADGCKGGKVSFNLPHGRTKEDEDVALVFFVYLLAVLDSPVEELAEDEGNFIMSSKGYKLITVSSFMRFYPNFKRVEAKKVFDRGVELFVTGINRQKMDAGIFGMILPNAEISYSPTVSIELKKRRFQHLLNPVIGSCVKTSGTKKKRYVHIVDDLFDLGGDIPSVKAIKPNQSILMTEAQHDD